MKKENNTENKNQENLSFYQKHKRRVKAAIAAALAFVGIGVTGKVFYDIMNDENNFDNNKDNSSNSLELNGDDLATIAPNFVGEVELRNHGVIDNIISAPIMIPDFESMQIADDQVEATATPSATPAASVAPDGTKKPSGATPAPSGNGGDKKPVQPTAAPTAKPTAKPTVAPTSKPVHKHKYVKQPTRYESLGDGRHVKIDDYVCLTDGAKYSIKRTINCGLILLKYNSELEYWKCSDCGYTLNVAHNLDNGTYDPNTGKTTYRCTHTGCNYTEVKVIATPTPKPTPIITPTPDPTPTVAPTAKPTAKPTEKPHIHDLVTKYSGWVPKSDGTHTRTKTTYCKDKHCNYEVVTTEEAVCSYTTTVGPWSTNNNGTHSRVTITECSLCGDKIVKPATVSCSYDSNGKCLTCGYKKPQVQVCDHSNTNSLVTVHHPSTESTCDYDELKCPICNTIVVAGSPTAHSWEPIEAGKEMCSSCGRTRSVSISTPAPTATPAPTISPDPTATPAPTISPDPTFSPDPTATPEPGPTEKPGFGDDDDDIHPIESPNPGPTEKPGFGDDDDDISVYSNTSEERQSQNDNALHEIINGVDIMDNKKQTGGKVFTLNPKK